MVKVVLVLADNFLKSRLIRLDARGECRIHRRRVTNGLLDFVSGLLGGVQNVFYLQENVFPLLLNFFVSFVYLCLQL